LERGRCPASNLSKPQLKQLELDVGLDWARPCSSSKRSHWSNCCCNCGRKYG